MLKKFRQNIKKQPQTYLTCQLLLLMSLKLLISLSWVQFKHKKTKSEVVFSRISDKYNSIIDTVHILVRRRDNSFKNL